MAMTAPAGHRPYLSGQRDRAAVTGRPRYAVGIAERDDGQRGRRAGVVGVAVGDAVPRLDRTDQRDRAFQGHCGQ